MKILVCGGRDLFDYIWFDHQLSIIYSSLCEGEDPDKVVVIQGEAKGADMLAKGWAKSLNFEIESYPADWRKYGHTAGPIRNQQMLDEGNPDFVVAFPGGNGTKDMVNRANKAGIEVIIVENPID